MSVYKYLDLSTTHLPEREMEEISLSRTSVYKYDEGAWVFALPIEESLDGDDGETFPVLTKVLAHARELGCAFVRFDCDGDIEPGLETFDW